MYCGGNPIAFVDPWGLKANSIMKKINNAMQRLNKVINTSVGSEKRNDNYVYNKENCNVMGVIYSQADATVSDLKLGKAVVADVGCETVAIYNTLYKLGDEKPFYDVLYKCEEITMFSGLGGCNPYRIGDIMNNYGYAYNNSMQYTYDYAEISGVMQENNLFIVSFWNTDSVTDGLHTVAFSVYDDGKVSVYNQYSNSKNASFYDSYSEFEKSEFSEETFISIYGFSNK